MIVKCTYCGGALKFDADIQMLVCEHCTSMFPVEETEEEKRISQNTQDTAQTVSGTDTADDLEMDCSVYDCKSCGAKLVINDVEAATYCAYCGQPTIVFNRIVKRRRPDYIIPFSITKDYALASIREEFIKGDFVPDDIKQFRPDLLRGIYVPYILYDMRYKDKQLIRSRVRVNNDSEKTAVKYYYREAVAAFREIPVDASYQLSNESSERLEPYRYNEMVAFKAEYLSGFYADLKDDDFSTLKTFALRRAKDMYNDLVKNTVPGKEQSIMGSRPQHEFEKEAYALFPVWFMVFHRNEQTYTIMVNGQTGKVVGALPVDRQRIAIRYSLLAFLFGILGFFLLPTLYSLGEDPSFWAFGLVFGGIPALIAGGIKNLRQFRGSQLLTTESSIKKFATERQDS